MIKTYNPTTKRYEKDPIRDLRKPKVTSIDPKIERLESAVEALNDLVMQISECKSITQVRKLLA